MRIHLLVAAIVLLGLLRGQTAVWGQSRLNSSQSSAFGSRNFGSTLSAGTRTFGGSSAARIGGSRLGSGTGGNVGPVGTSDRFMRDRRQPGQFVGADTEDLRDFLGAVQAGANVGGRNQAGPGPRSGAASRNPNRPGSGRGGGRTRRGKGDVRTNLNVAFDYPRLSSARVTTAFAARMARMEGLSTLSRVQVLVHDGRATLRGVVATDRDRALIEQLARLEAGIWRVKNELVVARRPDGPELSIPPEAAAEIPVGTSAAGNPAEENPGGSPAARPAASQSPR